MHGLGVACALWLASAVDAGLHQSPFLFRPVLQYIRPRLTLSAILSVSRGGNQEEGTLDEKVHSAMKKLGLASPYTDIASANDEYTVEECKDGACLIPDAHANSAASKAPLETNVSEEDAGAVARKIADSMNVDLTLSWAAMGATAEFDGTSGLRTYNEQAARNMIQQELDIIEQVPADSDDVKQLVSEGFETFLSRRALAFSDRNMDDARAILVADQMDEEQEQERAAEKTEPAPTNMESSGYKTLSVPNEFDPTKFTTEAAPSLLPSAPRLNAPQKAAKKSEVVFEATSAQIQRLVLESPVPVLLDVYADWCGPCKVLGPALEEMAIKSGGAFRLVKVNSDNERPVSTSLEVKALPSVFGLKDGKILNMFQGMPESESAMKNFMMGLLLPGNKFDPPLTEADNKKFEELSEKLVKMAGAACLSFSARERLNDRISASLGDLVTQTGNVLDADKSATILRSLLSNAIQDPYNSKFRRINLANAVVASKVAEYPACVTILKSVGFVRNTEGSEMVLGKGKKVVNVAPLVVARDSIDKWVDQKRYEVAAAARKRKDEQDRVQVQLDLAARKVDEEIEESDEEESDPDVCVLHIRMDGKKKIHEISLRADDQLKTLFRKLPVAVEDDEDFQITCVAKKLTIKSTDEAIMKKTFRDLGLVPKSSLVVALGSKEQVLGTFKMVDRAAKKTKKRKGSHTMQSVGIYSKDDNAKGELIDGGGGTCYEQDVTDDEEEIIDADVEQVPIEADIDSSDDSTDEEG